MLQTAGYETEDMVSAHKQGGDPGAENRTCHSRPLPREDYKAVPGLGTLYTIRAPITASQEDIWRSYFRG